MTSRSSSSSSSSSSMLEGMIARLLAAHVDRPGTIIDLDEPDIVSVCASVRQIVLSEPVLLRTAAPITLCGDLHGQFYDLLRILEHSGKIPATKYLFLGDYCDRGKQSIETLCLLLAYKVLYPDRVYLLRGNHETSKVSRMYGFYDECKRRYSIQVWKQSFCPVFDCLPIAAVISEKIFCVHGGLSPDLVTLEQIETLQRPLDVPDAGLVCDLLWSDPEPNLSGWDDNDRGVSYMFGADIVTEFLHTHDLDVLVRAHQIVEDGFEFFAGRKLVTLFSAANYCGEFENCGATMMVDTNLKCYFQILKPSRMTKRRLENNTNDPPTNTTKDAKFQANAIKLQNTMQAFGKKTEDLHLIHGTTTVTKFSSTKISIEAENKADHKSFRRSSLTHGLNDNDNDNDNDDKNNNSIGKSIHHGSVRSLLFESSRSFITENDNDNENENEKDSDLFTLFESATSFVNENKNDTGRAALLESSTSRIINHNNNNDLLPITASKTINALSSSLRCDRDSTEFQKIRFEEMVLILETEDLTQRQTSWGDVWEDLFYSQDELAEFRYEAYLEEIEGGEDDFCDDNNNNNNDDEDDEAKLAAILDM